MPNSHGTETRCTNAFEEVLDIWSTSVKCMNVGNSDSVHRKLIKTLIVHRWGMTDIYERDSPEMESSNGMLSFKKKWQKSYRKTD